MPRSHLPFMRLWIAAFALVGCAGHAPNPAAAPKTFDPRDSGAKADGKSLDTAAIQAAIDRCAADGGGSVVLSGGTFLSGSLRLKTGVTLFIDKTATLLGSRRQEDYPVEEGAWEGHQARTHAALISAKDAQNVGVAGEGTIDGAGEPWWGMVRAARVTGGQVSPARPKLLAFIECHNVRLENVTLRNSPSWTIHPLYCQGVLIDHVKVINPPSSPNTDGIDPDSCKGVKIVGCELDCGDDCIAIKSGRDEEGRRVARPCEDVEITGCRMYHGHGGVAIGSEMSGGVRNVRVSDCVFGGTDAGIRLKTRRGRGGVVEDVHFDRLRMAKLKMAITINMYYAEKPPKGQTLATMDIPAQPVGEGTPIFRDIHISNVTAKLCQTAGEIIGLPESPVLGLQMKNVSIEADKGMSCRFGKDWNWENVTIKAEKGESLVVKDVQGHGVK